MKKYFPFLISFLFFVSVVFLWDLIKLPYNNENVIAGEYLSKQFNPLNEIVRFTLLIVLPLLIYLISYLKFNKTETYSFNLKKKNYFLTNFFLTNKDDLNYYFLFFLILISIEFFSIDFNRFIVKADLYHEGAFLVHPLNYIKKNEFFKSTLYDYGLVGNNIGLIFNFLFGYYTLGSIKLIKLILIFFNKFFLLLIAKKTTSYLNFDIFFKRIFFIIFSILIISLPDYYDHESYFAPRAALFLFFIYLLGSALCDNSHTNKKIFVTGTFSLISLLWWVDIGSYINAIIIISIVFLLIHKEFKKIFFLIFGVLCSWFLFFLIVPLDETTEFFYQLNFIYSTAPHLLGIEYLKPFSPNSSRWTKALVTIYFTGILLVNLNFGKKYKFRYQTKIFISLLFLSSMVFFQSALTRSDSYHIKYSSGLYSIVFIFIFLSFIFIFFEKNKWIKNFYESFKINKFSKIIFEPILFVLILIFILGTHNKHIGLKQSVKNIINFNSNIIDLVNAEDSLYLDKSYQLALTKYKVLSKGDDCVQILTDDISFPYFLKKPTCTQFYNPTAQVLDGITEDKFKAQLDKASPEIILYESPNNILLHYANKQNTLKYIKTKYSLLEDYKGYVFYKKNN